MKSLLAVSLLVLSVTLVQSDDLQVGTSVGSQLAYMEEVKLSSIPLTTRTKNVFYTSEKNQIIKGISAIDLDNSTGKGTITAGGVGSTFANVRLKSDSGKGLHYQVQIFV